MWTLVVLGLVPHMYLDRDHAAPLLRRHNMDARRYILACLELDDDPELTGGLVRPDGDLFVVFHPTEDTTVIRAVLCRTGLERCFADVIEWHRATFPTAHIEADLPPDAQEVWEILRHR